MKPLVLGLASGYKWISVAVFLKSLRGSGYRGDIVLFVDAGNRSLLRQVRRHGAIAVPIGPTYPYHAMLERADGDAPFFDACAPHVRRYKLYQMYLRTVGERHDRVMLTDVKDVLFQRDPFAHDDGGASLCVFEEDPTRTIRDCPLNSSWIAGPFGGDALALIGERPILCSGTTVGTLGGIRHYCDVMVGLMHGLNIAGAGGDQGAHNYLIYHRKLDNVRIFPNEDGPVLTLAMRAIEPAFDPAGDVTNRSGIVPNVLHQYDRFPVLLDRASARYLTLPQRCWFEMSKAKRAVLAGIRIRCLSC